jgi:hypothetical protein
LGCTGGLAVRNIFIFAAPAGATLGERTEMPRSGRTAVPTPRRADFDAFLIALNARLVPPLTVFFTERRGGFADPLAVFAVLLPIALI